MADYIGISKPLAVVGVTPKPEINYFYGPWESINEALNNIPQLARIKGLTVGVIEDSEIVEYWFKDGVDLVLKSVDPELVYTIDEAQQIIDDLDNKINAKVTAVPDQRLITEEEADKLASAVTPQELSSVDINLQEQIDTHESQINIHSSQIQDIVSTYIDNKGYFATLTSLQASHPTPEIGDTAYVADADALSSTGYYIYNVVDGVWTSSTVEAPPVAVAIGDYALNGGSSKTLKEVTDELALKIDKTSIKQALGTSTTDVMSQKGTTDLLSLTNPQFIAKPSVSTFASLSTTYPTAQKGWAAIVTADGYVYWYNGTSWANTGLTSFPVRLMNILSSSRIIAVKNPCLLPELEMEFSGLNTPSKLINLPLCLTNMGLEYFSTKTKTVAASNLEIFPQLLLSANRQMPNGGQVIRVSYVILGLDNPPVGVNNSAGSRSRIFLSAPTQNSIIPTNTNVTKLADNCYKVDLCYKVPDNLTNISQFWLEIICETDQSLPVNTAVSISGINIVYSNDESVSVVNELASAQSVAALQISKSNLESISSLNPRTDILENGMSRLGEHYNLKLKSSAIGGDFPNVIGNVSQVRTTYQTPINPALIDLGIKRMGVKDKNISGNVELYISFNTALRQLYWDNNGKWCKIRWRLYSKNGTICTLTGNRLSVIGTGQSVNYANGKVTYKQINSQVFEVTALYQINVTGSLPDDIFLASVWESAIVPVDFVLGDFADGGVGIWFADSADKLNDGSIIEDWNPSIVDSELFLTKGEGDARYAPISTSEIVNRIAEKFKLPSVIKGGSFNPVADVASASGSYKTDIVDSYLNEKQLSVINYKNKGGNNNVEVYSVLNAAFMQNYLDNNGRYIKIKFLVYSKQGVMCNDGRLRIQGTEQNISYANGQVTYTQVSPQVFEVTMQWQIQQTALPSMFWVCTVWESDIVPVDFVSGDLGVTGFGIWFADTLEEIPDASLQYDWVYDENVALTFREGDARYVKKTDTTYDFDYNNIYYNQSCISKFLQKHRMKQVDSWNQLNVCLCGDSIFGRVDKGASWNPSSPEISYTPDMNNPLEVQAGYLTGHFPPNMWEQIVGFKILQMLQFKYADVKYFNHVAAEVTKSGTWTDIFPAGADCLRLVTTNVINSHITLDFNSATFVKFIYSCYAVTSATRKIKITFSDDNGVSWKTPAQLSLTESYASDAEGSGIYYLSALSYKWGNLIFGGLDKTKSYKIKVEKIDSNGTLNVWGFETWSNPRVNVIITAEGGNVASSQASRPQRFYSDMYKQDLVIYELPYLNDLGIGMINNFKGSITPSSVSPITPSVKDFYYCSQDGTYVNFNNLYVYAGSYIEWDGTNWKIGSTQIKQTIDELYVPNNRLVFEKLLKQNINVLTLITHTETSSSTRPYTQEYGLILLRMLVKQYGFASIDVNKYQSKLNITNIYSDGTHLNDNGVELYRKLIYEVLDPESECVVFSDCPVQNKKLTGSGASTDSVNFGFEMKGIPTVRLFNNNSRTIVSVTNSGFTTTGTGNYDWEAFVE